MRPRTGTKGFRLGIGAAAAISVLIATSLLLSGPAASAPSTKFYSATITPATGSAGVTAPFSVTIRNCGTTAPCTRSSTQSLGSANVAFPSGLALGAVTGVSATGGKTWTASIVGNTVQLRNPGPSNTNALAPGESVTVTVTATPSSCGTYALTTQTKQSNDFSGTGNDFSRAGSEPSVTAASGPLDHFVWSSQPAASQTAGTAFNANVTAYDTCGNVKTSYNGAGASYSGLGTSPNGDSPSYAVTWSNGVGSGTFTDYRAESAVHLTITDGAVSAASSSFTVAPGPLDRFVWSPEPGASQTAGVSFGATVAAYDHWGNQKTDYAPPAAPFSGLGTSPNGTAPSYSVTWTNGVGAGTFVDYRAESNVQITVADGAVSAGTTSFDVAPGPLGFVWTTQPGTAQTAGAPFGGAVSAEDPWGNLLTGYTGASFSLTGLGTSPNGSGPNYGSVSWSGGVGTISGVKDFKAETTQLVATDGAAQAASQSFTVAAGPLASLAWTQQPTETQKQSAISPAPSVTATDQYGNPTSGAPITASLATLSGTGTFTAGSTLTATTNGSGVAAFGNLAITDVGEYQLVATSANSVQATSAGFLVANQVSPCTGSCTASGSAKNNTDTSASVTGASTGSLAVSVILNTAPPAGVCGNRPPLGAGSFVNILNSGSSDQPNFTITWTLDKSIVNLTPNNGASQFEICLGAENLQHPDGSGVTPWTQKDGTPAVPVFNPILGVTLFWGILPDCPKKPIAPCVLSKNKDKAGDEVIRFYKAFPWDGNHFGV